MMERVNVHHLLKRFGHHPTSCSSNDSVASNNDNNHNTTDQPPCTFDVESAKKAIVGRVAITTYKEIPYVITDIDITKTPLSQLDRYCLLLVVLVQRFTFFL
jgi:hypothetical protein